jgi:hypothetical protein
LAAWAFGHPLVNITGVPFTGIPAPFSGLSKLSGGDPDSNSFCGFSLSKLGASFERAFV